MISITDFKACSGCTACAAVCPHNCITMTEDGDGFKYPQVDKNKCTECKLCENICPILNKKSPAEAEPEAYAVINKDEHIRENSSSGGVFYLLAEHFIQLGGVVFGAKFDENLKVVHGYAETVEEAKAFMGSKYTQSDMGASYKKVKEFLISGRPVFFSGTPCQIGGLKAYLRKEYDNLYCQDIICHGVPSPKVWEKYINYREAEAASKTRRTFFRHKKYGWKMYSVQFEFTNCTEYIQVHGVDLYMRSFLRDLNLRPSCYACSFKSEAREADITLADFWGIQKVAPDMDDDKGTSLVILHSEKGRKLFEAIRKYTEWKQVDFREAIAGNQSMVRSVRENPDREKYMRMIQTQPFEKVARKYCKDRMTVRVKRKLKSIYRKFIPRRDNK